MRVFDRGGEYDTLQGVVKPGICSKSGYREETTHDVPQDVSKPGICSKSCCREEE